MPNVPVYSSASVEPTPLAGVRQQTPYRMMQAATIGPTELVNAGKGMLSAGNELAREATMEQIQQNETQAKSYDAKQMTSNDSVLYGSTDPKTNERIPGYLDMMGQDAVDAYEATKKKITDIPVSLADNLQNPAQQQLVENTSKLRAQGALNQVEQHYRQQNKVAEDAANKTRQTTGSTSAVRAFDVAKDTPQYSFDQENPEANSPYQLNLQTVVSATKDLWSHMPPAVVAEKVKEALAGTYIDTIQSLADGKNGSPSNMAAAKSYFDSVRKDLSPEQEAKVKTFLDAGELPDKGLALAIEVQGKFGGIAAQEKELKRRFTAGDINAKVYNIALNHLQQDDSQNRQQEAQSKDAFLGRIWSMAKNGGKFTDLSKSDFDYLERKGLGPVAESYFKSGTEARDDSALYVDLSRRADNPAQFADYDLASMRGQLTDSHYQELLRRQTAINKNDAKSLAISAVVKQTIADTHATLEASGFKFGESASTEKKKQLDDFEASLREALAIAQDDWKEKKLTPQQQRDEANKLAKGMLKDQALAGTGVYGFGMTHMPVWKMTPEQKKASWEIPDNDRKQISDSLARQGLPVSEANIQRAYKLSQGVH